MQPDAKERNGEKVVEKDKGLTDDARKESAGPLDAVSTALKVAKAAKLKGLELVI